MHVKTLSKTLKQEELTLYVSYFGSIELRRFLSQSMLLSFSEKAFRKTPLRRANTGQCPRSVCPLTYRIGKIIYIDEVKPTVSSKSHNCVWSLCEFRAAKPALRDPNTSLTNIVQCYDCTPLQIVHSYTIGVGGLTNHRSQVLVTKNEIELRQSIT